VAPRHCLLLHVTLAPSAQPDEEAGQKPFTSFAAGYLVDQGGAMQLLMLPQLSKRVPTCLGDAG